MLAAGPGLVIRGVGPECHGALGPRARGGALRRRAPAGLAQRPPAPLMVGADRFRLDGADALLVNVPRPAREADRPQPRVVSEDAPWRVFVLLSGAARDGGDHSPASPGS